jgi:hypothetical protein
LTLRHERRESRPARINGALETRNPPVRAGACPARPGKISSVASEIIPEIAASVNRRSPRRWRSRARAPLRVQTRKDETRMFVEEIRRAVAVAPRTELPRLAAAVWAAHGAGALGDTEAQGLAEAIEARKTPPPGSRPASARRCGSRPRSSASIERRRRWVASGKLPPQLAARFTQAEAAALAVIALEVTKHGDCRLPIGAIAAGAGVCPRSVRNAIRAAEALGLLTVEERRLTAFRNDTNIVRVIDPAWRAWLRLRGGCKTVQRTATGSLSPSTSRPSYRAQGAFRGEKTPRKYLVRVLEAFAERH